ncbi:hypothetical protein BBP00_00005732, partial [Phytophthora kernoviae]
SFRRIFLIAQLSLAVVSLLDIVLVTRANLDMGIPDKAFVLGDTVISDVISRLKTMPVMVLCARLCPKGIEGTLFALLMSISNFSRSISRFWGAIVCTWLGIAKDQYDMLWLAIVVRSVLKVVPIFFLFLVPATDPQDIVNKLGFSSFSYATTPMVQTLALRATQDGVIWPRRPLVSSNGLLSCIQNLPHSSYDKRPTHFRAVAFNSSGELLAVSDEKGRLFVLFVTANSYALVQHLGVPTISCCFSPLRKTELLVTCEDEAIRCIDVQSQTLISTLRGHRYPARCASFQKSGHLALTASQDAVILWDTKDWSRYRVLNAGPGVEEAMFVSKGDLVAVCFQDDTVMMWELESLALSGRAPFIYVWEFESQTIIRIIELPLPIKQVVSHAFLPGHTTMISILGDDGSVFFLDVAAKNPQIKLEIANRGRAISAFDIECHAR